MLKQTFSERLKSVMRQKNISPTELEKMSGVTRQAITYILNNNLNKSKLSLKLALALNVSHDWLAEGVDDKSFISINEIFVFHDIYLLMSYLVSNNVSTITEKSVTHNIKLKENDFVFNSSDSNIYYYCSRNQTIKSKKYLELDVQKNKIIIVEKLTSTPFCFPIVEVKEILVN
ncbi:helix-turn-helix transcriptional regulator [Candidatus Hepatincola sp. Av]